jgi:hypothetical protein
VTSVLAIAMHGVGTWRPNGRRTCGASV